MMYFRLTRVRQQDLQRRNEDNCQIDVSNHLSLFEDYAASDKLRKAFCLVRVHRMVNKAGKKSVEFKDPVKFGSEYSKTLEVYCYPYSEENGQYKFNPTSLKVISAKDIICHVNLEYEEMSDVYKLPMVEKDAIAKEVATMFLESDRGSRGTRRRRPTTNDNFDGHFVETISPATNSTVGSSDQQRRSGRIRTVSHFIH